MRKVLASVGIGNASVDTILPSATVRPGETLTADVEVVGGDVAQEVEHVDLEVETRVSTDEGYDDARVGRVRLADGFAIEPDEELTKTAEIEIPYSTPVTLGRSEVWIETELGIDLAVDPEDVDYLDVEPTPRMRAVFDALEALGLDLRTADCEADPHGYYGTAGRFVQEFEFRPSGGPFAGDLDELEVIFAPSEDSLDAYVEVDRRGGLLSEALDVDERRTELSVTTTDAGELEGDLRRAIEAEL